MRQQPHGGPIGPWENPPPGVWQQHQQQGPPGPMGPFGGGGGPFMGNDGMMGPPGPPGPPQQGGPHPPAHFNRDLPLAHEEDLELIAHAPYKSIRYGII